MMKIIYEMTDFHSKSRCEIHMRITKEDQREIVNHKPFVASHILNIIHSKHYQTKLFKF